MTRSESRTPLHRLALLTALCALALIAAGGLVTSRDAGLSVPDWPLAYGQLNPPRWWQIENIRTEHGHRIIAFCVASLTTWLGWRIHRTEKRAWVRRLGAAAVAMVLLQAVLGGLRVLALSLDLAMIHGWVGQLYFAMLAAIATVTSPLWLEGERRGGFDMGPRTAGLTTIVSGLIVAQLVLGILIRHLGGDARPLLSNSLFHLHAAFAVAIAWLVVQTRNVVCSSSAPTALHRVANLLLSSLVLQIVLGVAALVVTEHMAYDRQATMLESWLPTAHVAVGAGLLGLALVLALHSRYAAAVGRSEACQAPGSPEVC